MEPLRKDNIFILQKKKKKKNFWNFPIRKSDESQTWKATETHFTVHTLSSSQQIPKPMSSPKTLTLLTFSIVILTTITSFHTTVAIGGGDGGGGNTNNIYSPCSDTRIQRSDGFTFGIAFSSRPSFFLNQTVLLSPCDRRLTLAAMNSQLSLFRPKIDEISLLSINTSAFFPVTKIKSD